MKKFKYFIMLLVAAFIFVPSINVYAADHVTDLAVNCEKTSVTLNEELGSYEVTNKTSGIEIEKYGSNTNWSQWAEGMSSWNGFGTSDKIASEATTHYALRLSVSVNDGWVIDEDATITFNGDDVTEVGYTRYVAITETSGYLYIDLGTPEEAEPGDDPVDPPVDTGDDPVDPEPDDPAAETYTIKIDLNGGTLLEEVELEYEKQEGDVMSLQAISFLYVDPPKLSELRAFSIDGTEYALDDSYTVTKDATIKFVWQKYEGEDYIAETDDYVIEFTEIEDREYEVFFLGAKNITDEEIMEMFPYFDEEDLADFRDFIDEYVDAVIELTSEYGDLIDLYGIEIYDTDSGRTVHQGPFKIKIKLTDEMKKYNTFKMIYINDDQEIEGEPIEFTIEGDYLVGELPHLSDYALVGSIEEKPATGDSVALFIILALISAAGIVSVRKLNRN